MGGPNNRWIAKPGAIRVNSVLPLHYWHRVFYIPWNAIMACASDTRRIADDLECMHVPIRDPRRWQGPRLNVPEDLPDCSTCRHQLAIVRNLLQIPIQAPKFDSSSPLAFNTRTRCFIKSPTQASNSSPCIMSGSSSPLFRPPQRLRLENGKSASRTFGRALGPSCWVSPSGISTTSSVMV